MSGVINNYINRLPFGDGKWLFEQDAAFASQAKIQMRKITKKWAAPAHFYHFANGGHVAAIQHQLECDFHSKVDLRRFFQQVTRNRITRRLREIGFEMLDAIDFAKDSTVLHREIGASHFALPYGFTQSPLLASLDLDGSNLGNELQRLVNDGFCVSVYVDDILVGHPDRVRLEEAWSEIQTAAARSNLEINADKSMPPSERGVAFNIEYARGEMSITADRMRKFEEDILYNGKSDASTAILNYVRSVNEDQATQLITAFPRYLDA